jgi:5'-phosphate synthase pdxT subunit
MEIWGTCAGVVLLANSALNQAVGGQNLIGGLDVEVSRNYFGSQVPNTISIFSLSDWVNIL